MDDILNEFRHLRLGSSLSQAGGNDLPTSSVSLVSHAHGRARREERGIERRELQEAVKYGRKERANPGRNGEARWRYTHKVCQVHARPVHHFHALPVHQK